MGFGGIASLTGNLGALSALATPWQLTYWLLLTLFFMALVVGFIFVGLLVYGLVKFHVHEVPAHLKNVARAPDRPPHPPEIP